MDLIIKFLDLGAPIYYPVVIWFLFSWLDKRVSRQANVALGNWLSSREYNSADSARAVVEVFDRIYSKPLLSWHALLRSFIISIIVTCLVVFHLYSMTFIFMFTGCCEVGSQFALQIATNAVADYLALFGIRAVLSGPLNPLLSLLVGPIIGVFFVLTVYTISDVARFSYLTATFRPIYFIEGFMDWATTLVPRLSGESFSSTTAIFLGAVAVYVWLPLFALSVIILRGLNWVRRVIALGQWFLRDGRKHPLQAIGLVAATATFGVVVGMQYF